MFSEVLSQYEGEQGIISVQEEVLISEGSLKRSRVCFNCGESGHEAYQCQSTGNGIFNGYCNYCVQWGHKSNQCKLLHRAHVSTDEFEVDENGYAYDAMSDYYSNFEEEHQEQGNEEDYNEQSQ